MKIQFLPGAWYAAALPDGSSYAALYASSRIGTSRGDVALLPGDQPLFLDANILDDRICVAGQSHAGRGLLLHDGQQWRTPDVPAFGESPVCFGLGDVILSAGPGDVLWTYHVRNGLTGRTAGVPLGVDGLRGVASDGTVLRGNNTRADAARVIGEYTELGDVTVGQSGYSCVALHAGQRYTLAVGAQPGGCRAIRFKRAGDQLAIAVHLPTGTAADRVRGTLLVWCSVAELALFPLQVLGAPAPAPVPVPQPTPEPKPVATSNRLDIVKAVAGQHPDLVKLNSKIACGILTEHIAEALHASDPGWGLLSKSAGENNYRGHAVDAVIYQPTQQVIDLMSGAGDRDLLRPDSSASDRAAFDHDIRVKWDEVGKRAGNEWMAPIRPDGEVVTIPPVPLPPVVDYPAPAPVVDLAPLQNELAALAARNALLEARVLALESKPAGAKSGDPVEVTGSVSYRDAIFGNKVTWAGKIK
jgi:hypothetical protein